MYDLDAQCCGGQGEEEEKGDTTPHAHGSSLVQQKLVLVRYILEVPGSSKWSDAIPIVTMKISLVVNMTEVEPRSQ